MTRTGTRTYEPVGDVDGNVGARIRQAREQAGISQRKLAFPGCSPAYISRVESGDRRPSLQVVVEISRRLDVDPAWLATGRPDPLRTAAADVVDVYVRNGENGAALDSALRRLVDVVRPPERLDGLA